MSSSPTECVNGWMVGGSLMAEWWNVALQRMLEVRRQIKDDHKPPYLLPGCSLAAHWLFPGHC